MISVLFQVFLFVFPWRFRRLILVWVYNYEISLTAKIGFSILKVSKLSLGEKAVIGHLNYIKNLDLVQLDDFTIIGNLNWITGFLSTRTDRFVRKDRVSSLVLGRHSAITNRHYLDCTSTINIGAFSTIAGVRSQFFTHSIDVKCSIQGSADIMIGEYCFIGTGVIFLPGSMVSSYSVVGAGAVLSKKYTSPFVRIVGNPAVSMPINGETYKYFHRAEGAII